MIALMVMLVCMCVVIQMVSPSMEVQDKCVQNVCSFSNLNFPKDISCVNETDCLHWIQPCTTKECDDRGTVRCIYLGLGDFMCECRENYEGRLCHISEGGSPVENDTCTFCYNGGSCIYGENNSNYSCSCPDEWTGRHCQQRRVPSHPSLVCNLPSYDLGLLMNSSFWYETARSDIPNGHIDACTTFNFDITNGSSKMFVNISSIPMNKMSGQREGIVKNGMEIDIRDGGMIVAEQTFLSSPGDQHYPMKASVYGFKHEDKQYVVLHLCQITPMFGKQEFVSLLVGSEPNNFDSLDIEYAKGVVPLSLNPTIQGHDFCSL